MFNLHHHTPINQYTVTSNVQRRCIAPSYKKKSVQFKHISKLLRVILYSKNISR